MLPLTVSEELMYSTVRIECYQNNVAVSTGSGFFFQFPIGDRWAPVIVTNKHVINGVESIKFKFTIEDPQGNPLNTEHFDWTLTNTPNVVIPHPDPAVDLCIIPFASAVARAEQEGKKLFYRTVDKKLIPSAERLSQELTAIEEITMVGYPNGLWDSVNNLPIIRRGITATHPNINHNGKEEFVIDAACFPGSSGSPVFILNENGYTTRNNNTVVGRTRVILMGILYAGPQIVTDGEIRVMDIPTDARPIARTNVMMNLGYVIKSSKLLDFEPILNSMNSN